MRCYNVCSVIQLLEALFVSMILICFMPDTCCFSCKFISGFNPDIPQIYQHIPSHDYLFPCRKDYGIMVRIMGYNATFNTISIISWRSALLVMETGVPGESHRPTASHWQTLSCNVVSSTHRLRGIRTQSVSGDRHWWHR